MLRLLVAFLSLPLAWGYVDCDSVLAPTTTAFTGICNNKWKHIKPYVRRKSLSLPALFLTHILVSLSISNSDASGLCVDSTQTRE